jgi:hypothetical protein
MVSDVGHARGGIWHEKELHVQHTGWPLRGRREELDRCDCLQRGNRPAEHGKIPVGTPNGAKAPEFSSSRGKGVKRVLGAPMAHRL